MKWPLIARRVVGYSMEPTLKQGSVVFATPLLLAGEGDVVVVHVDGREIIKRVKKVDGGGYHIEGDNPTHSRDSRQFGLVDKRDVLGRVFVKKQ